jgi:hypothetical protein
MPVTGVATSNPGCQSDLFPSANCLVAAVRQIRARTKVRHQPRKHAIRSPLDRAKGWEVIWPQVSPMFELGRRFANVCFVYFIGEEDDGPIKSAAPRIR